MNQLHLASSNPIQRLNLSHCNKTKCFKENTQLLSWWRSQMTWNRRYVQYMKTQVCCLMTECQLPKDRFSELNIAWCKTGTLTLGMLDKEYFFQVFAALVGTAWPCSVIFSIHQMFGHILALAVQRYFWTIKQSWKKYLTKLLESVVQTFNKTSSHLYEAVHYTVSSDSGKCISPILLGVFFVPALQLCPPE